MTTQQKKKESEKRYLTQRVISQRIGLTQGSITTIKQIIFVMKTITKNTYSRPLIIRRAIEVYAEYLVRQHEKGLLYIEASLIDGVKGSRGRPAKSTSMPKTEESPTSNSKEGYSNT